MSRASLSASNAPVRRLHVFEPRAAFVRLATRSVRLPLAVGFYAIASAVCTYPLVLHLADAMPPAPDTLLHSWILAWDIHALTTDPLHFYDGNVYFPFPLSLTYSDAMVSGALLVAPVLLRQPGPGAQPAHVGVLVDRRSRDVPARPALTGSDVGALIAGCIFAFCASRQAHLEHVNLLQFGWLPLALLCLHRAVHRGRTSDLLLFVFFTVFQALASVYLAWMMAIAYAIFVVVELAYRRADWRPANMARVAGALLLAAIVVIPVMWPYERMQQIYQFHWPNDVLGDLSAAPKDYLSVPPQNFLYADLLKQFAPSNFPTEHILFPGFAVLALALIAVVRRSVNIEVIRYSLMSIVAFVLSFGPFLRLDSQTEVIPLPYFLLLQFVPGFGVMRVPTRFDFLVMLGLAIVAGFGVARLDAALARWTGPWTLRSILAGVVVVTLLEMLPSPQLSAPIDVGAAVPAVYGWLRSQDPNTVVAEIPAQGPTGFASFGYEYMSTYHWHPLVNGASGFEPPASKRVANALDEFPDATAVANLRSLGVRYLIAHLDNLSSAETERLNSADLARLQLTIAATFGRDVVYEFAPPSNPTSLPDHVKLELPSLVGRGTTPYLVATITNDTPDPLFVGAPEAVGAQVEWNHDGATEDARQDLPVFFEPNRTLRLLFPAELSSSLRSAESAQLRVRLTGSIELEATQTVRIVDLPTSLQRIGLSATLEHVQLPKSVSADMQIPIEVTARNTGQAIWLTDPPGTTGSRGVVGVSVRSWTGVDGKVWPPSEFSTAHVQQNVNPGQSAVVTIHTSSPPVPGHYDLVLDMLSESVTWFDDVNGGARTHVSVDVEP